MFIAEKSLTKSTIRAADMQSGQIAEVVSIAPGAYAMVAGDLIMKAGMIWVHLNNPNNVWRDTTPEYYTVRLLTPGEKVTLTVK